MSKGHEVIQGPICIHCPPIDNEHHLDPLGSFGVHCQWGMHLNGSILHTPSAIDGECSLDPHGPLGAHCQWWTVYVVWTQCWTLDFGVISGYNGSTYAACVANMLRA